MDHWRRNKASFIKSVIKATIALLFLISPAKAQQVLNPCPNTNPISQTAFFSSPLGKLVNTSCSDQNGNMVFWNSGTQTWSAGGGGGTGTVTHTVGPLTTGQVVEGNGAADVKADANLDDGNTASNSLTYKGTSGLNLPNGLLTLGEVSNILTCSAGTELLWASNVNHVLMECFPPTNQAVIAYTITTPLQVNNLIVAEDNLGGIGGSNMAFNKLVTTPSVPPAGTCPQFAANGAGGALGQTSSVVAIPCSSTATVIPTPVQTALGPSSDGTSATTYVFRVPNPTLPGNLLTMACNWGDSANTITGTIADDRGNTWLAVGGKVNDGNQSVEMFYVKNALPGTIKITLTTSASTTFVQCGAAKELYNITAINPLDVTCGQANSPASTTASCGSMTPTVINDELIEYCINDNPGTTQWTAGSQPNITWGLVLGSVLSGAAAQIGLDSATVAINPQITMGTSGLSICVGGAFKSGTDGTSPQNGIHVNSYEAEGFGGLTVSSPFTSDFPSSGNLLVAKWIGVPGCDITGITDTNSNTWSQIGTVLANAASGDIQTWYVPNAKTSSTERITVTLNNATCQNSTIFYYDVSQASTVPFGQRVTNTGSDATGGTHQLAGVAVTPIALNDLILSTMAVTSSNTSNVTPGQFDGSPTNCGTGCGQENNGWQHYYPLSQTAFTFSWTLSAAAGSWASDAIEFIGATSTQSSSGVAKVVCSNVTPVTVSANVTTDQNLMSCTLPPGTLNQIAPNKVLTLDLAGVYSTPAASVATINLKAKLCTVSGCGSGTVITPISITSSANPGTVTNNAFNLHNIQIVTQTSGIVAAFESHGIMGIDLGAANTSADSFFNDTNTATVGTIDSTAQLFLQISVAFSVASASNSATARSLTVSTLN